MTKSEYPLFLCLVCKYKTNYSFIAIPNSIIFIECALYITKHLFFLLYDESDATFIAIFSGYTN